MPSNIRQNPYTGRLKNKQNGMTLIEVLVAMFVLAVGVLALLAVQLRTVSGVREAESQTIVSQIAQNLTEGMLSNPTLAAETDKDGVATGWTTKSYKEYLRSNQKAGGCQPKFGQAMSKAELAAAQICQFQNALSIALPEADVHFTICEDTSGNPATFENGSFNGQCNGSSSTTVVKVAWLADIEAGEDETAGSLKVSNNKVIYTYQAQVTD